MIAQSGSVRLITVPLRKMRAFQDAGHQVILLIGSFTAGAAAVQQPFLLSGRSNALLGMVGNDDDGSRLAALVAGRHARTRVLVGAGDRAVERAHRDLRELCVERVVLGAVVHHDHEAVAAESVREDDPALVHGPDLGVGAAVDQVEHAGQVGRRLVDGRCPHPRPVLLRQARDDCAADERLQVGLERICEGLGVITGVLLVRESIQ
mgnify:CR=1 FL=1